MNLTISVNLDNDSFQEDSGTELARLFREIQQKVQGIHPPDGVDQAIIEEKIRAIAGAEWNESDTFEEIADTVRATQPDTAKIIDALCVEWWHVEEGNPTGMDQAIHDTNGNAVGSFQIS